MARSSGPSKRLAALRKKRGMTQAELGALVGLSESSISRKESGEQRIRTDEVERFAQALGVRPAAFFSMEA